MDKITEELVMNMAQKVDQEMMESLGQPAFHKDNNEAD